MTNEKLEQLKKEYVKGHIVAQLVTGATVTDQQIQNIYDNIPSTVIASWNNEETSETKYEEVKPYEPK